MSDIKIAVFAFAASLWLSSAACADSRGDARRVVSQLRQDGLTQRLHDEAESVQAAFVIAEQLFQQDKLEMAEQFYLLTIQKARVFTLSRDAQSAILPVPAEPSVPVSSLAASPMPPIEPAPPITEIHAPSNPLTRIPPPPSLPRSPAAAATGEPGGLCAAECNPAGKLVGTAGAYIVEKSDTIQLIAAKLGVSRQHLARMNKIQVNTPLKIGQKLKYNNRKIVPLRMKNGIVINIPDRTLYFFKEGRLAFFVPVALGLAKKNNKHDWTTPVGKFRIVAKQKDPVWYVPASIRSEMEGSGKEVVTNMPPGPDNPLGKYAIKTSLPGILIHSTTKPGSIYSFASHGCIRVYPEHMEECFKEIKVNTPGEIIYRPVKLAVTDNGRVFLEVHQDAYGKSPGLDAEAKRIIDRYALSDRIDWKKAESVIRLKAGLAEDITL